MYAHSVTHSMSSVVNPLLHSCEVLKPNTSHIQTVTVVKKKKEEEAMD